MSETENKQGPMVSTGEQVSVDTREVDSIGGAKPEPEERPAFISTAIDPKSGEQPEAAEGQAKLDLQRDLVVRTEFRVDELCAFYGMKCETCLHFNHLMGQRDIERVALGGGTPAEESELRALVAELDVRRTLMGEGDDYVTAEDIFKPAGAEKDLGRYGLCVAMTSEVGEPVRVLPENVCVAVKPVEEGGVGHELWVAKDADTARQVQQMKDAIRLTAAGKA